MRLRVYVIHHRQLHFGFRSKPGVVILDYRSYMSDVCYILQLL